MWQFVLIAAVAGSGILVNRFFIRSAEGGGGGGDHPVRVPSVSQKTDQNNQGEEEENVLEVTRNEQQEEESFDIVKPDALITSFVGVSSTGLTDSWRSERQHEGIFRFSSLDRAEEGSRSRPALFKEKVNSAKRRTSTSSTGSSRGDKKRKFWFCLKRRRRTGQNAVRKCGSCLSKGNSLFSCGVGFGFMYLLSAGKAEINKLTADVEDFSTEVISNLQSEVCKRQLSRGLHDSSSEDRTDMEAVDKNKEPLMMTDSSVKLACPDDPKFLDLSSNDDGECDKSSILTEEVDLEALEMDKLEAEFESELQKIPNEPEPEYYMDCPSTELSVYALEGPQEPLGMRPNSSQFYGVSPTELDRKLCHVLIKQQGSQIAELESNLYLSQMKLREKDAELQKLKTVVCSLRDFSLETASVDDEAEYGVVLDEEEKEKEMNSNADCLIYPRSVDDGSNKIAVVKEKKSLCGVKRVMEFESYANSHIIQIHNALVS